MEVVFDLETNGLMRAVSKIWIAVAIDIATGDEYVFSDYDKDARPLSEFLPFMDRCKKIIGHNICMYDLPVLEKLFGWRPGSQKIVDTMIMSQVQNYKRFGFGHSLGRWGQFLGHPKPAHDDWLNYSPEMRNRCIEDVRINVEVYNYLTKELNSRKSSASLKKGLRVEHAASTFVGRAQLYGWPFDFKKAKKVRKALEDEMAAIKAEIEPKLKLKIKQVDKDPEFKKCVFLKDGQFAKRTADHLGVPQSDGRKALETGNYGDYCRVEIIEPEIGSMDSVKEYLYSIGWEPDDWNYAKGVFPPVKTTPKLTETSLEPLGRDGELIGRFFTLRARHSILKTWMDENYVEETGRIHGDAFVIGTPTGRARHEIIANIPSMDAAYGKEIRELFTCLDGYVIVGADSSSNQNRALCHYLNDDEYTKQVVSSDIHTVNQKVLEKVVREVVGISMGDAGRRKAKAFFYALIFGGGFGKLALIISGKRDYKLGKRVKEMFIKNIPGFDDLDRKIKRQFEVTSRKAKSPYILAIDGRPIYLESDHKALNYLLQSCEKLTCSAAIWWLMKELDQRSIEYQPLIFYHDEVQLMVKKEDAELVAQLSAKAFAEGPKIFGVTIMDGDASIGKNWAETH